MSNKCQKCGECCALVPVNDTEKQYLSQIDGYQVNFETIGTNFHVMTELRGTKCPFLNLQKRCDIYERRPSICRIMGHGRLQCEKTSPGSVDKLLARLNEKINIRNKYKGLSYD